MRLYCDNLIDFVEGRNKFYTIYSGYVSKGDIVVLHNEWEEREFEVIMTIQHDFNKLTLGLGVIE